MPVRTTIAALLTLREQLAARVSRPLAARLPLPPLLLCAVRSSALCFALGLPQAVAAQPASPPAAAVVDRQLVVELPCPAGAAPTAAIDGGPARAVAPAPLAPKPLALALLVDTRPAMAEEATPHATRLDDARALATALLDRLPGGSQVGLVTLGPEARVAAPLSADLALLRRALAELQPSPAQPDSSFRKPLAEALRLAAAQLAAAPPAQRAVAAFVAPSAGAVGFLPGLAPEGLLVVTLGEDEAGADGALSFHAADAAALAERFGAYDGRLQTFLGAARVRLALPVGELAPGAHRVVVDGCGAPLTLPFTVAPTTPPLALASAQPLPAIGLSAAIALPCAVGYLGWRRAAARAGGRRTVRLATSARVTTARRDAGGEGARPLRLVVWNGERRSVHRLSRRQTTLGREAGCDIRVESEWVSGLHARLARVGGGVEIVDLGSTNGTFLGDAARPLRQGEPELLGPGEVAILGRDVRLELLPADEDAEAWDAGAPL